MARCIHCDKEWKTKDGSDPCICFNCWHIGHDELAIDKKSCLVCSMMTKLCEWIDTDGPCDDHAYFLHRGYWYCGKHREQVAHAEGQNGKYFGELGDFNLVEVSRK